MKKNNLLLTLTSAFILLWGVVYCQPGVTYPVVGVTNFTASSTSNLTAVGPCGTGKTASLLGWTFAISTASNCSIQLGTAVSPGSDGHVNLVSSGTAGGGWNQGTIESGDGSEFNLKYLTMGSPSTLWAGIVMQFVGYKDGSPVSGAVLNSPPMAGQTFSVSANTIVTFTSNTAFNNVDEVRVTPTTSIMGTWSILDITIGAPVPPCITPTLSLTGQNNVLCNGGSTGSATVSATGGAPFTYTWSPSGGNAAIATGLSMGAYTCAATNSCGVAASQTISITQPLAVGTTTGYTNVFCNGLATGSASIIANGGTSPFTYTWSTGATSGPTSGLGAITGLTAGSYTVRAIDANNCLSAIRTIVINQPPAITVTPVSQTNVLCNAGSNGAAQVSVSGGQPGYSYNWAPGNPTGDGTNSVTALTAGSWTCTVTDLNSCTKTALFNITQPSNLSGTTVVTNLACFGGNNGAINLTPSGGSGSYTFNWLPSGPTTEDRTGLTAGTYTVQITDVNGCTGTVNSTLTQPASNVSGTTVVTNVACFGGNNGAINLTPSGGSGGYTFNWLPSGPTTEDRTGLTAGTYTVQITDVNGCTGTVNATLTQPASNVSGTTVVTNVACFGGNNGAINLTPTGGSGGYTFNWLPSGPTTEDRTGLTAGTYTVHITDVNGCTGTVNATLTQPASNVSGTTVVTNVACFGGNNGAINLTPSGGSGSYTFNWLPSGPTTEDRTGLTAGTYTVQITDLNGCTGTVNATLTQPTSNVSGTTVVTNVACFGGNNGAINLTPSGGSGGYTFNWLPSGPTTEDRTGLMAGTYTVQITDVNGCTGTVNATLTQPASNVSGTTVVTNVACFGGNNGAINLTPSGGSGSYTFNWLPSGPTTEDRTGLTAGTYTVQITDVNGCTGTVNATLTQPTNPVSGTTVITNVSCFGGNNGAINLTTSGGSGGYTFNWLPSGPTTEDRTGLTAGTYTVQITDVNGCTGTVNATVTQPTVIAATISSTNTACGSNTGVAAVIASGGTGAFTYSWSPSGGTAATASSLGIGTYSCLIKDANLCSLTKTITISTSGTPTATLTGQSNVTCNGLCNGTATVAASGGITPYTYSWSNGNTTTTSTGLCSGPQTCTITGSNGCSVLVSTTISQPVVLVANSTASPILCFVGMSTVTVTATGGTIAYTGTGTFTALPGTHTYNVTDANGCSATTSVTISQPAPLIANSTTSSILCNGGMSSVTITATGGTAGYNGVGTFTALAGNHTYTVTDANGCKDSAVFVISEPTPVTITAATHTNVACFGNSGGSAAVTAMGGTGVITYSWSPSGGTAATAAGLTAGNYTCTVTDANGCSIASPAINITEPTALTAFITGSNTACGSSTGSATITANGGIPAYTYSWSPAGGTSFTVSSLGVGIYSCTVTDANLCSFTGTVNISTSGAPTATIASQTDVTCNGLCNGTASLSVNGGVAPYTYGWSNGNSTTNATGLCAGLNTCTVTGSNGCAVILPVTIISPAALMISTSSSAILCYGSTTSVTVSAVGGVPAYSGTGTFTAAAGANSYTVTDANGCITSTTTTVTQPAAIVSSQTITLCFGQSLTVGANTYTASGIYTNTLSATNTCDSTVTTNLTVNPLLVISVNSGSICAGSSFTMIPSGATSYTYSSGSSVVSPAVNTTYTVTGMSAGCSATSSVIASVTVNPLPSVTATTSNSLLCLGETAALSAAGASSYVWNTSQTTASISVTPTLTTTYTVTGTNTQGCSNRAIITQSVTACTGIEAFTANTTFGNVYPNPNTGLFYIELHAPSQVSILNALGQIVLNDTMEQGKHELTIENQANGIYTVKIIQDAKQYIIKLIKN